MTIKHIRVFLRVYETGSITEAARQLFMTQPAVTRIIQDIEKHFGILLFERINQRLYATPAASEFYQRAQHVVATFDDLDTSLRNRDGIGTLRVGASITLGNFMMPRLAAHMKRLHPSLALHVLVAQSEKLHSLLLSNALDIAIIENRIADEFLTCTPFVSDRLVPVLPCDHPFAQKESVALCELASQPLLMRDPGSASRSYIDAVLRVHDLHPCVLWESVSTQALVRAAHAGLGVAILPEILVRDAILSGYVATCAVSDERFERTHYIVHHKSKFISASIMDFMALCQYHAARTNSEQEPGTRHLSMSAYSDPR